MLENAGLYKFYILGSICTHVFRDPNSQLFPASDTKGMRGKFDFCAFSRTVGFHKDCTIKYIQYVVHRHGETHRPLAAMLEIPLGHQLLSTIFLGLLPPAFLLPPFDFGFPIYIYLYFVPEHFIALW